MAVIVLVVGAYVLRWNISVHRVLMNRLLKSRVAWSATLVLFLIIFLGVWGVLFGLDIVGPGGITPPRAYAPVWFFLRNVTIAITYAAGYYTLVSARSFDFVRARRGLPERLVWSTGPLVWPWLMVNVILSSLNIIVVDPVLAILTEGLLPLAALIYFWPVTIAAMFSAAKWVEDSPMKQNMKWYGYLIVSIALNVWAGLAVSNILILIGASQLLALGLIVSTAMIPAVIYAAYRSSKSLIMTHKLTPIPA